MHKGRYPTSDRHGTLASSCCNLLDVRTKKELHRICDDVDIGDDESGYDCSHDVDDTDDIDFIDDMDGANETHGID